MVRCGEPGCPLEFAKGRGRRRHVHAEHRTLPHICAQCNNEPFLTDLALQHHIRSGHMNMNRKPRMGRRKKKNTNVNSVRSMHSIPQPSFKTGGGMTSLNSGFSQLSLNSIGMPRVSSQMPSASASSTVRACTDLFDARSEGDLNKFIADKIQPDSYFLRSCGETVDELVNFLQHNAPGEVRPTEVMKGGSLCKGTTVIGKSDVDLVVMIKGFTSVRDLKEDMPNILYKLETSIASYPNIQLIGKTHRAVEVKIRKMGYSLEADILPAIDLSVDSEWSRNRVFEKMKNESSWTRGFYSPCLAPLQKQLFEGIPTELKSLIRLVKYWKKEKLQGGEVRRTKWPVSYALELIAIDRWTKAGEPQRFDMTRALHSVLTSLVNHGDYMITLPSKRFYDAKFLELDSSKPHIIDPCNPFNNIYCKGAYDWDATADKAEEWLRKPLFNSCYNTTRQW